MGEMTYFDDKLSQRSKDVFARLSLSPHSIANTG